jgi:hypothetical protein
MSKTADLPTFTYTVHTLSTTGGAEFEHEPVEAAYFQEQGAFTVFKDAFHLSVAAFKTDLVTLILRSDEPVD